MPQPVALISHRYAPDVGGVERVVEEQAKELLQRGVPVEVITCDPSQRLPELEVLEGVVVRRFPTVARDSVYYVAPQLGAWLMAHAERFSVLYAHSFHTPLAFQSALAAHARQVPLFISPHYHGTGHTRFRSWLHIPYRPFAWWTLRAASHVICNTRTEEELVHRHFGRRVRTSVVPNGVDTQALATARSTSTRNGCAGIEVLSVGRLDSYKAMDRLVQAVPHLPTGSRLVLVGDGSHRPELERQVQSLGISNQVPFLGHVGRDDLLTQYRSADVFASLSRYESFGLAVLEGGVAGLPVLASDLPAHQEVAGYMAPGRVQFVSQDTPPREIARRLAETAAIGRTVDLRGWPLPTWAAQVDTIMAYYTADCTAASQRQEVPA
jgi:glycosyltransferase involved in cell wall biosynthesis